MVLILVKRETEKKLYFFFFNHYYLLLVWFVQPRLKNKETVVALFSQAEVLHDRMVFNDCDKE